MSDQPTSFHDFKWACGHIGPGFCKICHDECKAEIERLRKYINMALQQFDAGENRRDIANQLAEAIADCDD